MITADIAKSLRKASQKPKKLTLEIIEKDIIKRALEGDKNSYFETDEYEIDDEMVLSLKEYGYDVQIVKYEDRKDYFVLIYWEKP